MKPVTIKLDNGKDISLDLSIKQYSNGRIAVQATDNRDGIPWGVLTTNVPDALIDDGCSVIKDYSEHQGWVPEVLQILTERGDCKRVGSLALPHCVVPLVRWSDDALTDRPEPARSTH